MPRPGLTVQLIGFLFGAGGEYARCAAANRWQTLFFKNCNARSTKHIEHSWPPGSIKMRLVGTHSLETRAPNAIGCAAAMLKYIDARWQAIFKVMQSARLKSKPETARAMIFEAKDKILSL